MATTTPNFGWPVPTSSDLVKNGATAIEGLGDAIDASLLDLKGGTTGQVLKKNTNTDMDFVWGADSAGMTNPMTTTGDTIYSSSGSTPARLGIGTTGQVLTVASGIPSWATPAGGSTFSGCLVYTSAQFSISANTVTTLNWDTELYDTNAYHSTATNTDRLTIPAGKSGYYNFYGAARIDNSSANTGFKYISFQKNGTTFSPNLVVNGNNASTSSFYSTFNQTVYLAAADYITMRAYSESQAATINEATTFFQITYLGA